MDAWQRIGLAVDRPLVVTFQRDTTGETADAGHLAIQELVMRLGRGAGYAASFELPTRPAEPWRSADVGLRDDTRRRLILAECWNTIGDVGAATRSSERKRADAEALAAARWGKEPATVGVVWVVRATARNRALVARYPEVFAARFPGSSQGWVRALTEGGLPPGPTRACLVRRRREAAVRLAPGLMAGRETGTEPGSARTGRLARAGERARPRKADLADQVNQRQGRLGR